MLSLIDLLRPTDTQLNQIDAALREAWDHPDRLTHHDRWMRQMLRLLDPKMRIQRTPRRDGSWLMVER